MPQLSVEQALQIAFQHHQAGQLAQAEPLYRQILAQQPQNADALHYLGVLASQAGRNDVAVDLIRQALALKPNVPETHNNLGNVLSAQGHLDDAIASFRQAVFLNPGYAQACNNLGNALQVKGQLEEAAAAFRQAIAVKPDYAEASSNLGTVLADKGQIDQAIIAFRQAIALNPHLPEPHINLGDALRRAGQLEEAIAACRQAIALKPSSSEAHVNLGNALRDSGQLDEAIAAYRQAIVLRPNLPEAHSNLGSALADKGQVEEAIAACRRSIALKPNFPDAHVNLGTCLHAKGQLDEAIASYRQALALQPNHAAAHLNLGSSLQAAGQLDGAIASYRQAIALNPNSPQAQSNLVLTLHYHAGYDARAIAEEHHRWNRQHAEPLRSCIQPHSNDRTPDRRLRIGYVSPDFRQHPVGRFLLPLLANHDKSRVEIFAYAHVPVPDAMTQRLRSHTDGWRSIVGISDAQAAELIRQDRIDILVDLAGHTAHGRLLLFARKPAPVQATYLGYPDTTGLSTMDYRLTDAYADPPGQTEPYHSERLARLSPCAWCYQPSPCPPVTERRDGPITFGCFNAFAKVTEPMLRLWGRILQAVPESRLLLKTAGLGSQAVRRRVQQILSEAHVGPERLELLGHEPDRDRHLALYGAMDIALDTFPYHGTMTTCEALWMGVPVVTLAGATHVSRVGVSLLSNAGLPELVAQDPDHYVRIASTLAADKVRLAELRLNLRQQMEHSPLMDAPHYAANIEAAYRQIWRQWCADAPAGR